MSGARTLLLQRIKAVVVARPDTVAVREPSRELSYADFARTVGLYRAMLREADAEDRSPVGLLLDRSAEAYCAMWAAVAEGRAYVPLNPRYPLSRLRSIVEAAELQVIISHANLADKAAGLEIASHKLLSLDAEVEAGTSQPEEAFSAGQEEGDIAYILYTSGSTGAPKGVPISYENLLAFIDNIMATIPYETGDVCSQVCELSFDFSVHEIYQALLSGCTLCPARQIDLFNPGQFIAGNAVSVWISVPSLARVILANQASKPEALDSIRLSIFNGEPLTATMARDWQTAIPGAAVWNTYGPTECTVAVTAQQWEDSDALSEIGVVSIGKPLPGCTVALRDGETVVPLAPSAAEASGELLLNTTQRFSGYADLSLASPFIRDDTGAVYYRSGDKVLWRNGRLFHLGRLDHQVKIGGHRIELMEVEGQLRRALGTDALAVVTFPREQPTELVLFVEGSRTVGRLDAETLGLPAYMIPNRCVAVDALPVTAHGKLDRLALQSRLEDGRC